MKIIEVNKVLLQRASESMSGNSYNITNEIKRF